MPSRLSFDASPDEFTALACVRELVLRFGWNSTSYQIVNPGIRHWFAAAGDAVVGYASSANVRVVAGAPICALERLPSIVEEFETDARAAGETVCYFCAESRLENLLQSSPGYSRILLGAQPVWNPQNWTKTLAASKSLRYKINRARNKAVMIAEWSSEQAHNHPALLSCLGEWLASRGLPPLHFLVEPNTLARLHDRRVFVAEHKEAIVGFLILSPVARRDGFLFEQFVHRPSAPNGTVSLLIDTAMRELAKDGFRYVSLGLSPLSIRAAIPAFQNPLWLRVLLGWMRRHGRRFYNFEGLDNFKSSLLPESWEPIFAISNETNISPRTIYAIAHVFSGNHPFRLFFGGIRRAGLTEIKWLKDKLAAGL